MTIDGVRKVDDARVLAALSHPLRRRLMDVLKVDGPATASALAAATGQAVGNVSHHLKVLRECNVIEEVPELARDRRERWWRLVSRGLRWSTSDFRDDPATEAVAEAAQSMNLDYHVSRVRAWYAAGEEERAHWRDTAFSGDQWLRLTPAELAELEAEMLGVIERWRSREVPDDGAERRPVYVFAYGVPGTPGQ
ncbi:ArsR/SmtB family transcription factor [Catenuloplanes atrovinosus]|uniref:DNA-binding transcriptional ArsR family regulator n=1 Tax=Catenuloplanes atrovinosus TaxID=137266 RepID=A0AAE4CE32_9ACTN|nr:helix-turn-helix domain-containing protein [Catenuloplanes atrovinosus]MDR7278175.1 DNA-binding transcriptional ArsR family regulator [Catenuloplanes atrovinosus]